VETFKNSQLKKFLNSFDLDFKDYTTVHNWSLKEGFWSKLIQFLKLEVDGELEPELSEKSFFNHPWFPNLKLNFAENLLARGRSEGVALNFLHESGIQKKYTYNDLWQEIRRVQGLLKSIDFKTTDCLACFMPNIPETVFSMLGCTSLGGQFTSTSCDFGVSAVVDRFEQSNPRVLVMPTGYSYNGKYIDLRNTVLELKAKLSSVEKIILVDFLGKIGESERDDFRGGGIDFYDELEVPDDPIDFIKVPFSHPLYIMYSSGTTGRPKCIIHSTGGTLIQHLKELRLHADLKSDEKILYFTTCGWMMWNWLVSSLAVGSEVVLYEGSPGYPDLESFISLVDREEINLWGTSPKFLRALELSGYKNNYKLNSLRSILSTGAPLIAEQFDFIHDSIKKDVKIESISGGTDIISCFMLGNPMGVAKKGKIQGPGLGMDIDCFDSQGKAVRGELGELVCKSPFVSQPTGFLNDKDNQKYHKAYFERFENVWHHGDFISIDDELNIEVFGRSDSTLNPGGVRIGTGEIYRQTEKLDYLVDTICVGKKTQEGDVDVVLFVKSTTNINDSHVKEIKTIIRENTTYRHVPKFIYQVSDIPYTRSGKKMEVIVSRIINNNRDFDKTAVSNPECLEEYEKFFN
jgi:acetoacetyl-CoA synthetase